MPDQRCGLFLEIACVLSCFCRVQLCDPMDCSPPGPSVHGILQAGILEWVAMPSSRGSCPPRDRTCVYCVSCTAGEVFTAESWGSQKILGAKVDSVKAHCEFGNEAALSGRQCGRVSRAGGKRLCVLRTILCWRRQRA